MGSFTYDQLSLAVTRMTLLPGGNFIIVEADCAGPVCAVLSFFITILVLWSGLEESLAFDRKVEIVALSEPTISKAKADFLCRIFKIISAIPIPISHRLMASNVPINDSFDRLKI